MRAEYTDAPVLAAKMHRLQAWLDASELPASCTRHLLEEASAVVTVDASSHSPAASLNRNAIRLCSSPALSPSGLQQMAGLFSSVGIARFFVWMSPGSRNDLVRDWLAAIGARRVPWTRYPVMLLANPAPPRATDLVVHEIDPAEFAAARVDDAATGCMEGFRTSLGREGFHHFAAFDGTRMVATAALARFEDLGYLTYASTAESFRRRGAQSALIAARIALAGRLGARQIVSQTLTMLEDSHANLMRAGFREAYENEVYECGPGEKAA
jgi:hypothetical protein